MSDGRASALPAAARERSASARGYEWVEIGPPLSWPTANRLGVPTYESPAAAERRTHPALGRRPPPPHRPLADLRLGGRVRRAGPDLAGRQPRPVRRQPRPAGRLV